jgi:RimJ/RimL family protein N-acetyltransferase
VLRPIARADAPLLYAGWTSDPDGMRYLPWQPHRELAETEVFIERALRDWESGEKYRFIAREEHSFAPVGFGMLRFEEGCRAEIGFVVFPPSRGRGVAARIAGALSDWALAQTQVWRVFGICDVDNVASARAMAAAGFTHEGRWERWGLCPALGAEPRAVDCWVRLRS